MKFLQALHTNVIYAIYVIAALTLLNTCNGCSSSKEDLRMRKQITELEVETDSLYGIIEERVPGEVATKEDIKEISEQTMFQFLIYEDDLDRGKISLSDIKNKLDE